MDRLLSLALRASIMYVASLVLVRLTGKRSLGKLSALDFVAVTILGDFFDDVFWAEVPLAQALTAFGTVIALHMLVAYGEWRIPWIARLVSSTPTVVIRQATWNPDGLAGERTPQEEVLSELRREEVGRLDEIEAAQWEPSGQISVQLTPSARPAEKRDIAGWGVDNRA